MNLFFIKEYDTIVLEEKYNENKNDIIKMIQIQEKVINSTYNNIQIDATKCNYISSTCLAILSSLALISKHKHISITFLKESKLLHKLIRNRFHQPKNRFCYESKKYTT